MHSDKENKESSKQEQETTAEYANSIIEVGIKVTSLARKLCSVVQSVHDPDHTYKGGLNK